MKRVLHDVFEGDIAKTPLQVKRILCKHIMHSDLTLRHFAILCIMLDLTASIHFDAKHKTKRPHRHNLRKEQFK